MPSMSRQSLPWLLLASPLTFAVANVLCVAWGVLVLSDLTFSGAHGGLWLALASWPVDLLAYLLAGGAAMAILRQTGWQAAALLGVGVGLCRLAYGELWHADSVGAAERIAATAAYYAFPFVGVAIGAAIVQWYRARTPNSALQQSAL